MYNEMYTIMGDYAEYSGNFLMCFYLWDTLATT